MKIMYFRKRNSIAFFEWALATLALSMLIYMHSENFSLASLFAKMSWFIGIAFMVGAIRVGIEIFLRFIKNY